MPDGGFNIAVAPLFTISKADKPLSQQEGVAWANQIADYLGMTTNSPEAAVPLVIRTWGPQQLAFPRWDENSDADELAVRLNATVLVYGTLEQISQNQWQLEPRLFFSETAVKDLAPELQGDYALGKPIPFFNDLSGKGDVNQALRRRLEALAPLLLGLQQYGHGDEVSYDEAVTYFEKAAASSWGQSQNEGQGILYSFLASGYSKYASWLAVRDEELYLQLLHKAESAFQKAIQLDPEYARAYNGLGFTQMLLATPPAFIPTADSICDLVGFDAAYRSHQRALYAKNQSMVTNMVRFDAELGMARVRLQQAIECRNAETLKDGTIHFENAIELFDNDDFIKNKRLLNAIISYGEYGRLKLYLAQYSSINPEFTSKPVDVLLDESRSYLEKAIKLADGSNNQEIGRYLEGVRLWRTYGICVRDRDASLNAFKECNQQ
jgi:tetratricopeptide (TPR) repeat protein